MLYAQNNSDIVNHHVHKLSNTGTKLKSKWLCWTFREKKKKKKKEKEKGTLLNKFIFHMKMFWFLIELLHLIYTPEGNTRKMHWR